MIDDELATRIRQLILSWSVKHAPDLASAKAALERTGVSGSVDDVLGPHPDLLSWTSTGSIGQNAPMSDSEFHVRLGEDVEALVDELMTFKDLDFPFEGPRWFDVTALVERAVMTVPDDGLLLVAHPDLEPNLFSSVLRAWERTDLDSTSVERIVQALSAVDLTPIANDVARLLADGGGGNSKTSPWHRSTAARELSLRVWSVAESRLPESPESWLNEAIASASGRIALYWVHVISADWSIDPAGWTGHPDSTKSALDLLLGESDPRSTMAEIVLASQIHFLFRADREWTEAKVLPLLQWGDAARAVRTWDGFLVWGRWEDTLLDAGLFEAYLGAISEWTLLPSAAQKRLSAHLAAMALYSVRDPLSWLPDFVVRVTNDDRVEWARQVSQLLGHLSGDTVESEWDRWMRQFWTDRLASVPRPLGIAEASEMATWIVYLGASVEEGVELAQRQSIGLGRHNDLLRLLDGDRFDKAPLAFVRLVTHALRSAVRPFSGFYNLRNIVVRARNRVGADSLEPLVEQAMRLGFADAPSW